MAGRVPVGRTATSARLGGSGWEFGESVTACVGHLDAEGVADDVEREAEVPAGDAAVSDGDRAATDRVGAAGVRGLRAAGESRLVTGGAGRARPLV